MISSDLKKQIDFLREIERLKIVYRQNGVIDKSRYENSAEHSWHIAVMAMVLQGYCKNHEIDVFKLLKMLLIHDIVEVYAGDTHLYDDHRKEKAKANEMMAAERIFGLLPDNQKQEFMTLWNEFESMTSWEAKYAAVLDNLQPLLNHLLTGDNNKENKILKSQVINKKKFINQVAPELWQLAIETIEASAANGLYEDDKT